MKRFIFTTGVLLSAGVGLLNSQIVHASAVPDTASSIFNYNSGNLSGSLPNDFTSSSNNDTNTADATGALGALTTTSGGYGYNVFASQYNASQLAFVGGGGTISLVLKTPVAGNGYLGIFTSAAFNLGNPSAGGAQPQAGPYTAGTSPSISEYSALSQANISVGYQPTGGNTVPALTSLAGGATISLDVPSNYYTDTPLSVASAGGYVIVGNGTTIANQSIPYYFAPSNAEMAAGEFDSLHPLANEDSTAIEKSFNGGAGGTWIPLDGSSSSLVNFIQFSVPSGDALILDSVSAVSVVPEPTPLMIFIFGVAMLPLVRRRRFNRVSMPTEDTR